MASPETEAALLAEKTDQRIKDLERTVSAMLAERNQQMKWGIATLGAAVLGMASYIFNLVTSHLK